MSSTEKCGNTIYKHFCHNLCQYLKEQEPYIYEKLTWFRRKENLTPKKSNPMKLTSQLPYILQKEEVKYIRNCLRNLDDKIQYLYTIHHCVGCLMSDCETVKQVMEHVSEEMYGGRLRLKIKGGENYIETNCGIWCLE